MGIFSESKVYVASVPYNLAGPEKDRPSYLKTTVISNIIGNNNMSMGDTINHNYIHGPGIKFRQFANWCQSSGYNTLMGITNGTIRAQKTIDPNQVAPYIPGEEITDPDTGELVRTYPQPQVAHIGKADTQQFLARWLYKNQKGRTIENWEIYPRDDGTWRCWHWPTQQELIIPAPDDYDPDGMYIYCDYVLVQFPTVRPVSSTGSAEEPIRMPPDVETWPPLDDQASEAPWVQKPDLDQQWPGGHWQIGYDSYSWYYGNGPEPVPAPGSSYNQWNVSPWDRVISTHVYERREFIGVQGAELKWRVWKRWNQYDTILREGSDEVKTESYTEAEGSYTKYVTYTYKHPVIDFNLGWWETEHIELIKSWSENRKFIYKQGSGTFGLDRLFGADIDMGRFLPFIPVRIDNKMVSEMEDQLPPNTLTMSTRALKKAIGAKYSELEKSVKKNESLKDIDYAYVMFGVSLNVQEKACREYLFTFFNTLRTKLPGGSYLNYQKWVEQWHEADYRMQVWRLWFQAQRDPNMEQFGKPEPPRGVYPILPDFNVRITSGNMPVMNYDMTVRWIGMDEISLRGVFKPGKKKGDIEVVKAGIDKFPFTFQSEDNFYTGERNIEKIQIFWQDTPTTYRVLSIWGLEHSNMIYRNKDVLIRAWEALDDKEESGMIIPLHADILKSMSLVKSTQMCTANSFIVFNCYQVVKKKWYQTGLFKLFLVVVVIVVSIVYPPTAGLLGANAAVGAALGFTGLTAAIVGAVANALAAMILSSIIGKVSAALLGDKLGAIIGTIASVVAIQVGSNWVAGKGLTFNMAGLFRADNLLKLTLTGVDALSKYVNASTMQIVQETQDLMKQYESTMEKIQDAWDANIGTGADNLFNPMQLTEAAMGTSERMEGFLGRTLLVGSDIADMSLAMISKFTELTLALDNV